MPPVKAHLADRPIPAAKVRAPRLRGIERPRLFDRLVQASDRCVLVVAPAGSGKTTLLAQHVERMGCPVAWYRAEAPDTSEAAFIAHLAAAITAASDRPELRRLAWRSVEEASNALDALAVASASAGAPGLVIVIDDVHTLAGTPAEAALERLISLLPVGVGLFIASRQTPGFNLSRLRANGLVAELGADDLRFRHWEVEELFQDFYGDPLLPDDLALLARRTEGWAAGLQLFHLATQAKPPGERRRVLGVLTRRSRLVSDYLAENVLLGLPPALRRFLLDTCVLGRMTGPLCDEFLSSQRSEEHLIELQRRQIFTEELDGAGTFRYHEVLRSYLEATVAHEEGEAALTERFARAAVLLERCGAPADAVRAYCRCGNWTAASRVLGLGSTVAGLDEVLDSIPAAVIDADPWLLLATARHRLAAGAVDAALIGYERADRVGVAAVQDICARERRHLRAWVDPVARQGVADDWLGLILRAAQADPAGAASAAMAQAEGSAEADRGPAALASGVAHALAGSFNDAAKVLRAALREGRLSPVLEVVAELVSAVVTTLSTGQPCVDELERSATGAEGVGVPWIVRIARATLALGRGHPGEPAGRHPWDDALVKFFGSIGAVLAGAQCAYTPSERSLLPAAEAALAAAGVFHRLEVGVLEAWSLAYGAVALAQAGAPEAPDAARRAERVARTVGAKGPLALALWAAGGSEETAVAMAQRCGLWLPPLRPTSGPIEPATDTTHVSSATLSMARFSAAPAADDHATAGGEVGAAPEAVSVRVVCLGQFSLEIGGVALALRSVRPRARTLLRLLAIHAGEPVHRETIVEALWPDAPRDAGPRNLHVAISSLRQALESGPGGVSFVRDGDAYIFSVPPDGFVDVPALSLAVSRGRAARVVGDPRRAQSHFQAALDLYRGEVLSDDGPAEWALPVRDRCRRESVHAAEALAEMALEEGRHADAARAAARGLDIDRYDDALWRLLATAHELNADRAGAARARLSYAGVLGELGLTSS